MGKMHSYCVVKILSVLPPPRCSPGSFHVCGMCSLKFSLTSPLFSTSVGPQHSAFELGIPSFVFFFFLLSFQLFILYIMQPLCCLSYLLPGLPVKNLTRSSPTRVLPLTTEEGMVVHTQEQGIVTSGRCG
jgi:hypothetical protein